ncbi:hypothetical protein PSACC_00010 [Paramicrosporidium saccamoebae]|uniref:Uncharacterized protein n=1 Tax=Paramicrosporidium saccamoebae TaxID=1246581 RepID=A0A2H9TQX0_9FUNG|nr:hypothetical protein PSACC_00010 [Paramicrosporidium saccamoebae]
MVAIFIFLAFVLATQASSLVDTSEFTEDYPAHMPDSEHVSLTTKVKEHGLGGLLCDSPDPGKFTEDTPKPTSFVNENSYSKKRPRVSLNDAKLCREKSVTPPNCSPDLEKPYRAKILIRKAWFFYRPTNSTPAGHIGSSKDIIRKLFGVGLSFTKTATGLSALTRYYGLRTNGTGMVFSDSLKKGSNAEVMKALRTLDLSDRKSLMQAVGSSENALAVGLAKKRITIYSIGSPPLAAVLLRVEDGQYRPILFSEDCMSVEGTLKSKDIIVVGVCHIIWGGLSFPQDISLEDIATATAGTLFPSIAVAAIIR